MSHLKKKKNDETRPTKIKVSLHAYEASFAY